MSREAGAFDGGSVLLLGGFFLSACFYAAVAITQHLSQHTYPHDVGLMDYCFYWTLRGRWMYSPLLGASHFGVHFTPTLLILVPFYAVFDSPLTLLLFYSLFLVAGALPLYFITKHVTQSRLLAAILAATYLTNYYVASVQLANHYEAVFPFCVLSAVYCLLKGKSSLYWIFLILALGVKTDTGIYLSFLGLYVAFGLKQRRTGWATVLVSTGWFLMACGIVRHYNVAASGPAYLSFWKAPRSWLPLTGYGRLCSLLSTVGFLSLLDWKSALTIVPPAIVLMTSVNVTLQQMLYYRSAFLIPFVFLSAAMALQRLCVRCPASPPLLVVMLVIFVRGAYKTAVEPTLTDGFRFRPFIVEAHHLAARRMARELIPKNASVAAGWSLYCQVPHRDQMYTLDHFGDVDYVFIGVDGRIPWWAEPMRSSGQDLLKYLERQTTLVARERDRYFLFRRKTGKPVLVPGGA